MHRPTLTATGFQIHTCEELARKAAAGDPYAQATCDELMIDFRQFADTIQHPTSPLTTAATVPHETANLAAPEVNSRGRAFWRKVAFRHFRQFRYAVYNAAGELLSLHPTPRKAARECRTINSQLR